MVEPPFHQDGGAKKKEPNGRNIFLLHIYWALSLPMTWLATLYYFLVFTKGLPVDQALYLMGLQELILIFFEIPTGIIADKISRRFSIILGNLLVCLPFAFFYFVDSYSWFVVIFIIKAIGRSLTSGADKSLLYDTLCDAGREQEYKIVLNRMSASMYACTAISILIGGWIATFDPYLPLILPIPLGLLAVGALLLMDEPRTFIHSRGAQTNLLGHVMQATKIIFTNKRLLLLVSAFAILDGLSVQMKWFYTPVFVDLGINVAIAGGLTTILYGAKAIISFFVKHIDLKTNLPITLTYCCMIGSFILVGLTQHVIIAMLCFTAILVAFRILMSEVDHAVQRTIPTHIRATSQSTINMLGSLFATISMAGFGLLHAGYGLWLSYIFLAILVLLSLVVFLFSRET